MHSAANCAARAGPDANCSSVGPTKVVHRIRNQPLPLANVPVRPRARKRRFVQHQARATSRILTWHTGISSCLVLNKTPFCGPRGLTGTFASGTGLMAGSGGLLLSGPPLEQFASGPALAGDSQLNVLYLPARATFWHWPKREIRSPNPSLPQPGKRWARRSASGQCAGSRGSGDRGRIGVGRRAYRRSLEDALRQYVWSEMHRDVPLLSASLGNDAGTSAGALWVTTHVRPRLSQNRRFFNCHAQAPSFSRPRTSKSICGRLARRALARQVGLDCLSGDWGDADVGLRVIGRTGGERAVAGRSMPAPQAR